MKHILLIDDDEQFRSMLTQMLEAEGYRVTQARDGDEGLRKLAQGGADLIITDILMPNKDGIETIMALSGQGSSIPVIAISGGRRNIKADFNLQSAELMGVRVTLAKPFTRMELREALRKALGPDGTLAHP